MQDSGPAKELVRSGTNTVGGRIFLGLLLERLLVVGEGCSCESEVNRYNTQQLLPTDCMKRLFKMTTAVEVLSAAVTVEICRKFLCLQLHLTEVLIHSDIIQEMKKFNLFLAEKMCS